MLPPLQPGHLLRSRYCILSIVAQGGMGSIYKAEDQRLAGRITAIKEIHTNPTDPPDTQEQNRRQFQREASVLARLDHPNLPKVSDFFAEMDRDFLVMDFVPGDDLRHIIQVAAEKGEFLPENQVLAWAHQIANALAYLHDQVPPVLHRDIKPGNIKLTPDGLIKLVDFGLVKVLSPDDNRTITVVQGRGSVLYTPLEQYGGDTGHTDVRSDIYAFGATLYHLFTNQPPATAKDRFLNPKCLELPQIIRPALTTRVAEAVMWAVQMHPQDRPASIEQFYDALMGDQTVPHIRQVAPTINPLPPAPSLSRSDAILSVIALALLVIAVVVTLYAPVVQVTP